MLCFRWSIRQRYGRETREDLTQDLLVHLMERSLPRFRSDHPRAAKLETYLFGCLQKKLIDHLRRLGRAPVTRSLSSFSGVCAQHTPPLDLLAAAELDQLIERIKSAPEQFFSANDADLLKRLAAHHGRTRRDQAKALGMSASNLSRRLAQMLPHARAAMDHSNQGEQQ